MQHSDSPAKEPEERPMEDDEFERHRPLLMGIAYRMLGSSAEAEDAVQDAWLRWQSADTGAIGDPRAWLSTTIARICIDKLKSAQARRETYPGTWLPEPVLTTTPLDIESIQVGFLVLLERLDPKERAVFLLHQVFDYSHAEIGEILDISEVASRQALHRAKEHVAANRPRFEVNRETHARLLSAFVAAVSKGDVDALSSVIAEDVVLYGDHGERVRGAILRPIVGRERVARFFASQALKLPATPDLDVDITDVNGWPALVGRRAGAVTFVINIETDGAKIVTIRSVLNPKKLLLPHVS
jgi:RNA polymerase sigma-70 factor (ECF subfamily)